MPGGSVRYVLITEDVVKGQAAPLYFGRDGKVVYLCFLLMLTGPVSRYRREGRGGLLVANPSIWWPRLTSYSAHEITQKGAAAEGSVWWYSVNIYALSQHRTIEALH